MLVPNKGFIVVKTEQIDSRTPSGLTRGKETIHTVVVVGEDVNFVSAGDQVVLSGISASYIFDGVDYRVAKKDDVVAKVGK